MFLRPWFYCRRTFHNPDRLNNCAAGNRRQRLRRLRLWYEFRCPADLYGKPPHLTAAIDFLFHRTRSNHAEHQRQHRLQAQSKERNPNVSQRRRVQLRAQLSGSATKCWNSHAGHHKIFFSEGFYPDKTGNPKYLACRSRSAATSATNCKPRCYHKLPQSLAPEYVIPWLFPARLFEAAHCHPQ